MTRPKPRSPTAPDPGYYLVRQVAKGWQQPAELTLENGIYSMTLNGDPVGTWTEEQLEKAIVDWLSAERVEPIARLVMFGEPCDETEYRHRLATRQWAREYRPTHPSLSPHKPMNLRLMPLGEF